MSEPPSDPTKSPAPPTGPHVLKAHFTTALPRETSVCSGANAEIVNTKEARGAKEVTLSHHEEVRMERGERGESATTPDRVTVTVLKETTQKLLSEELQEIKGGKNTETNIAADVTPREMKEGEQHGEDALEEVAAVTEALGALELKTVGVFYDDAMLLHEAHRHPERPDRLRSIKERLTTSGLWTKCSHVKGREASDKELLLVHSEKAIYSSKFAPKGDTVHFGADTYANRHSEKAARTAVGGLLSLTKKVLAGNLDRGFAFIRPPGHHAEAGEAMGFCLFNNVAVTARYAQAKGATRVAIVDWDVHHGNGTQHIFQDDASVLYMSVHKGGNFYPGTGKVHETGDGDGKGYTINCPFLQSEMGDAEYLTLFKFVFGPILREFAPHLLIVSAGFDCGAGDLLGPMRVSTRAFAHMLRIMLRAVEPKAKNFREVVCALEGGYDLDVTSKGAQACIEELLGICPKGEMPLYDANNLNAAAYHDILECIAHQKDYWNCLRDLEKTSSWAEMKRRMEPKMKDFQPRSESEDRCTQQ